MNTPVTVMGAGLGGLMLARVLHVHLFEACFGPQSPQSLLAFFTAHDRSQDAPQ